VNTPTDRPAAPPLRTWRPMAAWSAGILLVLGLVWFVGAVVVPVWQVHRLAATYEMVHEVRTPTNELGDPSEATRKIRLYLRLPSFVARHKLPAIVALGCYGTPGLASLLELSCSADEEVRAQAYVGILRHAEGDECRFRSGLAGAADKSPFVRSEVAFELTSMEARRRMDGAAPRHDITETLVALMADPDEKVRAYAASAAWPVGDTFCTTDNPGVLRALAQLLADPSPWVRRAATEGVGYAENVPPQTVQAIERLKASDPDAEVRRAAEWVLDHLEKNAKAQAEPDRPQP